MATVKEGVEDSVSILDGLVLLVVMVVVLSVEVLQRGSLLQSLAWAKRWKDRGSKERVGFIVAGMFGVVVAILSGGVDVSLIKDSFYTPYLRSHVLMGSQSGSHRQELA